MMFNDDFSNVHYSAEWSVCGFPECEHRFSMLQQRFLQCQTNSACTDEVIQQNNLLKIREQQLKKQLEEEIANNEEMRIKLLGYMKAHLPLEEEKNKYVAQYDEVKNKYDELHLSNSAVTMHNKQLSGLVAEQERDFKLAEKKIAELKEELTRSKKEGERSICEKKKTESSCRTAIASIVKAAEVLKTKKLLPVECSRKFTFWKKMLEKLSNDSTNNLLERSDSSDLSDDSDIEAMGDLLQKQLVSAEGQDYPSTGNYVEKFEAKFNFNSTKNTVEMGINTDVPVSAAKLNVGVQTLLKSSEYSEIKKSIFSPEPGVKGAETKTFTFLCDSDQQLENCGRLSVRSDSMSSDDQICFESSIELLKDQTTAKLLQTPLSPIGSTRNKSPSLGRLETVADKINGTIEKLCVSKLSSEEANNLLNNLKLLYEIETSSNYINVLQHLKVINSHLDKKPSEVRIVNSNKNINIYPLYSNTCKRRLQESGRLAKKSNFKPLQLSCKNNFPIEHQYIASKIEVVSEFSELYKISPIVTTHSSKVVSSLRDVNHRPCNIFNKVNKDIKLKIEKDLEIEMAKVKLEVMTQLRNKYNEILKKTSLPVIRNSQIPITETIKRKNEDNQNTHKVKRFKIVSEVSEDCESLINNCSSGIFTVTPCIFSKNKKKNLLKNKSHSHFKFLNKRHILPKLKKRNKKIPKNRNHKPYEHLCCPKSYKLFSKKRIHKNSKVSHTTKRNIRRLNKSSKLHNLPCLMTPDNTLVGKKDLTVARQESTTNLAQVGLNMANCISVPKFAMEMSQNGLYLKEILDEIKKMNFKTNITDTNCVQSMSLNRTVSEFANVKSAVLEISYPEINPIISTEIQINVSHLTKPLIHGNILHERALCRGVNEKLIEISKPNVSSESFANISGNSSKSGSFNCNFECRQTQTEQKILNKEIDFDQVTVQGLVVSTKEEFQKLMLVENCNLTGVPPSFDETVITLDSEMDGSVAGSRNYNNINSSGNICENNTNQTHSKKRTEIREISKKNEKNGLVDSCLQLENTKKLGENSNLLEIGSENNSNYENGEPNSETVNISLSKPLNENGLITNKNNNKLDLQRNSLESMNNSYVNFSESNTEKKFKNVKKSLQKDKNKLLEGSKVRRSLRLLNSSKITPKSEIRSRITEGKKIKKICRNVEDIPTLEVCNKKTLKNNDNSQLLDKHVNSNMLEFYDTCSNDSLASKIRLNNDRTVKSTKWSITTCPKRVYLKDDVFLSLRHSPRHVHKDKDTKFSENLLPKTLKSLSDYKSYSSFTKVLSKSSRKKREYKKLFSVPVKNKASSNRRYQEYKIRFIGKILELSLKSGKIPIETSVCQTNSNNKQVEVIINKYLSNKLPFNDAIEKLQNLSDVNSLSKCIVQAVCQDSLQSIKRRKTFTPPLIVSQQKIVILICTLQEENSMYKNLIDSILILIENFISTLINCSLEVKKLFCIGQFYSTLCRLENSVERAHAMCYDALYCLGEKGFPLIYGILITFPEAMPNAVIGNESPRCVAIAHIILSTKQNNSPMTSKLKTLLQDQYGYEATTFMPNDPDFNIVEKLQETLPYREVYASLLLLGKNRGYDWAVKTLIKKILFPVVIARNYGNVEDNVAEEVIDLISAVSLPYLDEHDFTEEMGVLADILANSQSSLKFEMTVAVSLARMVKSNFVLVANALYNWIPNGKVSELFLHKLGSLLHLWPYRSWTSFMKSKTKKMVFQ